MDPLDKTHLGNVPSLNGLWKTELDILHALLPAQD